MGRKRAFNVLVERRNGEKARPIIFSFILLYRRANFLSSTTFSLLHPARWRRSFETTIVSGSFIFHGRNEPRDSERPPVLMKFLYRGTVFFRQKVLANPPSWGMNATRGFRFSNFSFLFFCTAGRTFSVRLKVKRNGNWEFVLISRKNVICYKIIKEIYVYNLPIFYIFFSSFFSFFFIYIRRTRKSI